MADNEDPRIAEQIAALLRFQASMTPERWEAASAKLVDCTERHISVEDCPLCEARKAFDTLRQELGQ